MIDSQVQHMVGCLLFDLHISVLLRVGARRRLWPPRAHQPSRYLLPKSPAKIGLFFKKDQHIISVCVSSCSSSPAPIQGDPIRDDQDGSRWFCHFDCLWHLVPFRKRSEHSRCPRIHKMHIEAAPCLHLYARCNVHQLSESLLPRALTAIFQP